MGTPTATARNPVAVRAGIRPGGIIGGGLSVGRVIPIPAPFHDVPRHITQVIAIRRKVAHPSRAIDRSKGTNGVESEWAQINVGVKVGFASVVCQTFADGGSRPRKTLSAQSSPSRLLPLRLGWQPVAVDIKVRINRIGVAVGVDLGQEKISVIHRRQAGLNGARVAPFDAVIPINRLHRMIGRLAGAAVVKAIAGIGRVVVNGLPQAQGHQIRVHVKRRNIDVGGHPLRVVFESVTHCEGTVGDGDHSRRRGIRGVPNRVERIADTCDGHGNPNLSAQSDRQRFQIQKIRLPRPQHRRGPGHPSGASRGQVAAYQ